MKNYRVDDVDLTKTKNVVSDIRFYDPYNNELFDI
jgi:hypothetical protein